MPNYAHYDQYRPPLTDEDKMMLAAAAAMDIASVKKFTETPGWTLENNKVLGGFRSPDGLIISSRETVAHINLAKSQAEKQLEQQEVPMPEEEEATLRFPGTSPRGKYSIIDMKLAHRWTNIEAEAPFTSLQVASYVTTIKLSPFYAKTAKEVEETSKQHRLLTRASKLCRDEDGSQMLHNQARALEKAPCVVQMKQLLAGMEYLQGRREIVPQDVIDLYKNNLGIDLENTRETINTIEQRPEGINLKFENFDDIGQQHAFSNPRNWNKTAAEMKTLTPSANEVDNAVRPYSIATVKQQLTPAFDRMERAGFDFRDLIIVDGKSIQEHLNGLENSPRDKEAAKNYASMLIAAALMNGKKVEAFVPREYGKLPEKPSAVEARGYEPKNSGPVVLNAWERFFSRFGFYKEKVAQADEYKRTMEARERMIPNIEKRAAQKLEDSVPDTKKMFFGGLEAELAEAVAANGKLSNDKKFPNITRTSHVTACICMMARKYPVEDILNPDKLMDKKRDFARYYLDMVKKGDIAGLGAELADGTVALQEQMNRISQNTDFKDPVQRAVALPTLCAAAYAGYDIYQDVNHNVKLLEAYSGALLETDRVDGLNDDEKINYGKPRLEQLRAAFSICSALQDAAIAKENLNKSNRSLDKTKVDVANLVVGDLALSAIRKDVPLHECAFNTEARYLFIGQLAQQKEIQDVAKAISENPQTRAALQQMLATTPMSQALQVNTAEALTNPNAHGGVQQATEKILTNTKVTMAESMKNILNGRTVQAVQPRR